MKGYLYDVTDTKNIPPIHIVRNKFFYQADPLQNRIGFIFVSMYRSETLYWCGLQNSEDVVLRYEKLSDLPRALLVLDRVKLIR